MAKIYGQLERAALEVLSSDPAQGVTGRAWWNSTTGQIKIDDGAVISNVLRNDQKCVFGTSGTAGNNIRFNRAASGVLQLVTGADTTAEGSLSTALAQLSFKHEGYTDAGKPAAGRPGRIIWITDLLTFLGDNGTSWNPIGGGGGGSSLNWIESANNAPITDTENNFKVRLFESGQAQKIYAAFKVPTSYTAGRQINLKVPYYSPDSSNTALLSTVATLIRKGTDAVTTTTNQRTSTNTATTLTVANKLLDHVCDLTDTSGAINSVAVSAGDIILIELTRGTDSSTSDIRGLIESAEVTLS